MKFCSKIFNYIKKLDIYGYNFELRYQNETTYSTPCGLFFSLISYFFIITIIISYSTKLFSNSSFSIVSNSINNKIPEINLKNYPFIYGIVKEGIPQKLDPNLIQITLDRNIHYPIKDKNNFSILNRTSISIELEKCNLSHFKEYENYFKNYDYEKYLCPKNGQNLSFRGRYSDQVNGYDILEMHLIKCENKTNNNNCKSDLEIESFLQNSYISLIYISNTVNHDNFSYPVIPFIQSDTFAITTNNVKRYYYYFSKEKYISDNGIFFNEIKKIDFFQYKYTLMDFLNKEVQSFYSENTLLEINFSCIDIETEYLRVYLKLKDIIGIIGGWTDIVARIFNYISYYFSKKSFVLELCNSLMSHNFHKMISIDTNKQKNNVDKNKSSTLVLFYKIKSLSKMNNNYIIKEPNTLISNINNINNKVGKSNTISYRSFNKISNEEKIFDINNFKNKKNKTFCFYFKYFIFPFWIIQKYQSYHLYSIYSKVYYKFMSIDVIIPFIINNYISKDINKKAIQKDM